MTLAVPPIVRLEKLLVPPIVMAALPLIVPAKLLPDPLKEIAPLPLRVVSALCEYAPVTASLCAPSPKVPADTLRFPESVRSEPSVTVGPAIIRLRTDNTAPAPDWIAPPVTITRPLPAIVPADRLSPLFSDSVPAIESTAFASFRASEAAAKLSAYPMLTV